MEFRCQSYQKLLSKVFLLIISIVALACPVLAGSEPPAPDRPRALTKIAVTIDDFPESGDIPPGMTRQGIVQKIIDTLRENGVVNPYGFANGLSKAYDPDEMPIFKMWLATGHPLGNHTYSHVNLNRVGVTAFLEDIAKEDQFLAGLHEDSPNGMQRRRVFRYPYMDEGDTVEKRNAVRAYLSKNGYRIAEVTTDYSDWVWNAAYIRCLSKHDKNSISWLKDHVVDSADRHVHGVDAASGYLLNRPIPQILLVHVIAFNSITLDAVLKHLRGEGVQFVSLDEVLADPAYNINPNYAYDGGRTFLDQIAESRGLGIRRFDDAEYTTERLDEVCKPIPTAANSRSSRGEDK